MRPCLEDLVRGNDEVLTQHGHVHRHPHGVQVGERPTEPAPLRQDAHRRRARGLELRGEGRRIHDRRKIAL